MYQILLVYSKNLLWVSSLSLLCAIKTFAQTAVIDSLKELENSKEGVNRFDLLYDLSFEYIAINDLDNAVQTLQRANEIAVDFGDSLRIVKSLRVKGQMLWRLNRSNESIKELIYVLNVAKRNGFVDEQKTILNVLAVAFTLNANYDQALEYHFQALLLREKDGDHSMITESLNNIGLVYFKLRNYSKALDFYYLALEHDSKISSSKMRDRLLINIGLCHNQLGNFYEARKLFTDALAYCDPNCSDATFILGRFGLGVSYYGEKKFSRAKSHFSKSLEISAANNDRRFRAENLIYLAHIYVFEHNYDSALIALEGCELLAKQSNFNELLIAAYKEYANIFSRQNNFEKASLYQDEYITLKDSIYNSELIDRIAKIQTDYQERINLQTIAENQETIARQRLLNIAIAVIAVLAFSLILVLYHSIKVKRKVNADLSDAKAIIEDQNKLLRSSNVSLNQELKEKNIDLQKANDSLHRVNEELDNFIYKTSHDIRGPLASLKGMCNVALMDVKDPLALNYLNKLDITAEKLNTILTRLLIVNQINNSVLNRDRIDFQCIVDDILMLERKKGIPKRLAINKTICAKTVFYSDAQFVRIILENLIDNAIKFYNDSQRISPFVTINIGGTEEYVSINVIDNGIGISEVHPNKIFQMFSRASERSETGGIGLYITKTAAEKLGGSVHLKTTPEGYTEFYVKLPYSDGRARQHGSSMELAS